MEEKDKRMRRYIRIDDMEKWATIDKIMAFPGYEKSFNKVINDALFLGLPLLYEKLYGKEYDKEQTEEKFRVANYTEAEFYGSVVQLLGEILENILLNKTMLSALVNVVSYDLPTGAVKDNLDRGALCVLPKFAEAYESNKRRRKR